MKNDIAKKNCILIVDDDFINRELLKNIFSSQYTFEEAENGRQGLEQIERHLDKLCAIILYVQMPEINGIELLRIISQQGITERVPVFLITAQDDAEVVTEAYTMGVVDVVSKPVSAIVIQKRVKTVIELFSAREALRDTVSDQEKKLLENAKVMDALHRSTIETLATAIEFRDVDSGQHVNRIYSVTKYILTHTAFGEGLSGDTIESIARGAIMHDVGKIAISDIILNKPGKLTREEFEIMKQHTVRGAELLEHISQIQLHESYLFAADIARHHHERWDGRGYPDGLKGDEISIASQVVSIVDVYDALVSVRVYKKAFTPDEAVNMIKSGQCGVFNPKLVECFLEAEPVFRKWYSGEEPVQVQASPAADAKSAHSLYSTASGMVSGKTEDSISDVMLLIMAVQNTYDAISAVNLTKNTFQLAEAETVEASGAVEETTDFSGKRVLLVEDNAFNREIARYILEGLGLEVEEAENGAVCLHRVAEAEESRYDLVLMDIQMPVMDGYTAAKRIRAHQEPGIRNIPIVAMTANAYTEDVLRCAEAGMNAHVAKPIDMDRLLELLGGLRKS